MSKGGLAQRPESRVWDRIRQHIWPLPALHYLLRRLCVFSVVIMLCVASVECCIVESSCLAFGFRSLDVAWLCVWSACRCCVCWRSDLPFFNFICYFISASKTGRREGTGVDPAPLVVLSMLVGLSDIASFSCFARVLNGAAWLCLLWFRWCAERSDLAFKSGESVY